MNTFTRRRGERLIPLNVHDVPVIELNCRIETVGVYPDGAYVTVRKIAYVEATDSRYDDWQQSHSTGYVITPYGPGSKEKRSYEMRYTHHSGVPVWRAKHRLRSLIRRAAKRAAR